MFVHGSFATSSAWRGVLKHLDARAHQLITLDLNGCGESSPALPNGSLLEQDIEAVLMVGEEAAEEPLHLVGHSYGGIVCLGAALAGRIPIASLTLFEPLPIAFLTALGDGDVVEEIRSFVADYEAAHTSGEQWAFSRVIRLWGGPGAFDAMPDKVREAMAPGTADNIRQWHDNLAFTPDPAAYSALEMPVKLIQGEHANPIVKCIILRLSELLPSNTVHEIAGAGHFMIHSHDQDCADLIKAP
ncbi:MAG: alpha/beta hydrolase [Pseudomonadota bacterium]